ncbi:BTAD domain-containing putative transcriptional regulator [Cellulomonas sp. ICMP 17802]|uniref:nSTAND1 domain-containing NTPase n=1 Tax=Cellulomonas sp. ICMP 17802 TaxID=3239199 RepID=UPI00351BDAB4
MSISVLGPLRLDDAGALGPRERVVLAALVVHLGSPVDVDTLADAVWGQRPPTTWNKQLQAAVARLRRALGPEAIETTSAGYRLVVDPGSIDAHRFEEHVARARTHMATGEPERATSTLERALGLWNGPAFVEVLDWDEGRSEAERLQEIRRIAEEDLLEAQLAAGDHRTVAGDGESRVRAEPLRERRWAALALAQYRCGRQADALATLRRARRSLSDELGIDPGPQLSELELRMLRQDPTLLQTHSPAPISPTCPYKGLAPYGERDQDDFFGRDAEVVACLERLRAAPLLVLAGASGCGKSSLLRAGIVAELRRRGHDTVVVVPGTDPVTALESALSSCGADAVLAVDQLEELFVLRQEPGQVQRFCRTLVERAQAGAGVVVAIRSDQITGLGRDADLAALADLGMHLVPPLVGDALRDAVERPAERAGLRLEPGLVDVLLRDVEGDAGALPLLSHALVETWRRRDGGVLTLEAYRATGGISGAVARSADQLYEHLDPHERDLCRSLMLRLVAPSPDGPPTRHRLASSHLSGDAGRDRVIAGLIGARLLTADEGSVEIAHESLAHAWPRLQAWLDEDASGLRIMRHLVASAEGWESLGRPEGELYRGARLEATLEWRSRADVDLTTVEAAFLDAAVARSDREATLAEARARRDAARARRLRVLLGATAGLLVVSLVASGFALANGRSAKRQADSARTARDDAQFVDLVSRSLALRRTDRAVAALLAAEAYRRRPASAQARSALLGTFTADPGFLGYSWVDGTDVPSPGALLPGGTTALVALAGATPAIVDVATGAVERTFDPVGPTLGRAGSAVRLSADGTVAVRFAVGSNDEHCDEDRPVTAVRDLLDGETSLACAVVTTYDVASGSPVDRSVVLPWQSGEVALSPDGSTTAVTRIMDGTTLLLGARDGRVIGTVPAPPAIESHDWGSAALAFGPDGSLYVGSTTGPVRVVDPTTAAVMRTYDVPELSTNVSLSVADGALIGVGHRRIVSLDLASGAIRWDVPISGRRESPCPWVAVSVAAGRLWCGTFHGVIEERLLSTGERTGISRESGLGNVGWMEVTADGRELVTFSVDAPAITRWRLDGSGPVTRLVAPRHVLVDRYQPGGGLLLTAVRPDGPAYVRDDFRQFEIWDPDTDTVVQRMPGLLDPTWITAGSVLAFDPDADASVVVDAASGGRHEVPDLGADVQIIRPAPDGESTFVVTSEGTVDRVDVATGEHVGPTMRAPGWPLDFSASPDLSRVAVTVYGGLNTASTYLFDGRTGEQVGAHVDGWSLTELGRSTTVVSSGVEVEVHDLAAGGQARGALPSTIGEVDSLQLSTDGDVLAATSRDGTVSVYDVRSRIRLADPLPTDGPNFVSATLRPDGTALAATGRDGILVWDLDARHLFDAACRFAGRELTAGEWETYLSELGSRRATCSSALTASSS